MDCLNCGKVFEGRAGAKYCSGKCRAMDSRKRTDKRTELSARPQEAHGLDKRTVEPIRLKMKDGKLFVNRKPSGKVSRAEIDALPADVRISINRLCDSDPVRYTDRQDRFVRAALYQRKFPDELRAGYRSESVFTGKLTLSEQASYRPACELQQAEHNHISKPGDSDYDGICNDSRFDNRRIV